MRLMEPLSALDLDDDPRGSAVGLEGLPAVKRHPEVQHGIQVIEQNLAGIGRREGGAETVKGEVFDKDSGRIEFRLLRR